MDWSNVSSLVSLVASLIALGLSIRTLIEGRVLMGSAELIARDASWLREEVGITREIVSFRQLVRKYALDFDSYLEAAARLYEDPEVEKLVIHIKRWTNEDIPSLKERARRLRQAIIQSRAQRVCLLGDAKDRGSMLGLVWRLDVVRRANRERRVRNLLPINLFHVEDSVPGFLWYQNSKGDIGLFIMREADGEAIVTYYQQSEYRDFVTRVGLNLIKDWSFTEDDNSGCEQAAVVFARECRRLLGNVTLDGSDPGIGEFARQLASQVEKESTRRADLKVKLEEYLKDTREEQDTWSVWSQ